MLRGGGALSGPSQHGWVQRGSVSVLAIALLVVAILLAHMCALIGAEVVRAAKAQAVADLAALSAADTIRQHTPLGTTPSSQGWQLGCAAADQVIAAGGDSTAVELVSCEPLVHEGLFSVRITINSPGRGFLGSRQVIARAGPQH